MRWPEAMVGRHGKRHHSDGVAFSEWIFFGLLLIVPIACFGTYAIVSRVCAGFVHFGDEHRYCGFKETVSWFVDAGGWWKFLIVLGVIGGFMFLGRDVKEEHEPTSSETGKGTQPRD